MNAAKKAAPKRKAPDKSSDKSGSKTSKGKTKTSTKKPPRKGSGGSAAARASDDEDNALFNTRRAKRPKTGRIGRTAGKNYPPEIQAALGRAHLLYINGKVVEASTELADVVVHCSSIPEPYALLALIYKDGKKFEESLLFYKLACARDTRNVGNHTEAARIAGILGDHASKLEALRVLARLDPNDLNVAIQRARCLVELQKPRQALDVYAKAAKRFPREYDIYLDLAEGVECVSPQQNVFVHQALASCLRRVVGKRYLAPDVRDLADGFSARLREIKLEHPKPKRLPPRAPGLPTKREGEVAMTAAALLVGKLMESRKRQEPQYEVAVQVVEGLGSWLDYCRAKAGRGYESGDGNDEEEPNDAEYVDSDSDVRGGDSNDDGSDEEEDDDEEAAATAADYGDHDGSGGGSSADEEDLHRAGNGVGDEPMDNFELDPGIVSLYGICQLYCGDKEKADKALCFLRDEDPGGPRGDMMIEVAKVYAETGHLEESLDLLRHVAQSKHARRHLAGIQLGAAYGSQGNHELAAEVYTAVLVERPLHAAALMGLAEAAYWRGGSAVSSAVSALTPAVEAATEAWAIDDPKTKDGTPTEGGPATKGGSTTGGGPATEGGGPATEGGGPAVEGGSATKGVPATEGGGPAAEGGLVKDGGPVAPPPEDDDEGEFATGFQRLQLLMQWATLSLMEDNREDFACVAVPLVSVALGQLAQRQEFEINKAPSQLAAARPRETARDSRSGVAKPGVEAAGYKQSKLAAEGGEAAAAAAAGGAQASRAKRQFVSWKPTTPVEPILGKLDWQVGLRGKVFALTERLLATTDVLAQVGRRAIFWHMVEVVRALLELGSAAEASRLVGAASRPNGLLRGPEKEDLQSVVADPDTAVLSTMPGGSPLRGPASREGLRLGSAKPAESPADSQGDDAQATAATAATPPCEQFYPPPWRCVEEKDDDGLPRRAGRPWRPASRPLHGSGPRRSRSRALMELDERKDDGDAICALVRSLSRKPGNDATWNLLQRVVAERGIEQAADAFHVEQVDALVSRHRERSQGLLYRGHDAAVWNRAKHALKLYSLAHMARPEEPLPILCLATHICRMVTVMGTMVEDDGVCILQALACLHQYAELRKRQSLATPAAEERDEEGEDTPPGKAISKVHNIPEAVLEQEILYNLGRGYHQVGLSELAMEYYNRALRVEDERGHELRNWHGGDGVTKETAHNMCALLKSNGQTAMALCVLNKYLAIG